MRTGTQQKQQQQFLWGNHKRTPMFEKPNKIGLNTILFQIFFTYTYILGIQQIDQDLIVSSWLIYIISWNVHNLQHNRWFKHMGHMTWKYSMVTNRKSRNFDVENKQINKWKK